MFRRYRFNRICRRIKELKIQGATDVAKAALKAYYLYPNNITKRVLINLRPTEPMLTHVLNLADKLPRDKILHHFDHAQERINSYVFKIIQTNDVIFTHCHSTNVVNALINAKKRGKTFEVYNTETRPLYQGRITAKELSKAGIKVTTFVDSAMKIALSKSNKVMLGADALLDDNVINKVGSGIISEIAYENKIPLYVISDSWKHADTSVKLEQRDFHEVWDPKKNKIHVKNPAFESIPAKYVKHIITELGLMSYNMFLKEVHKK